MLMYNLLEYSDNYYMTSGNLWNYYGDEAAEASGEFIENKILNPKPVPDDNSRNVEEIKIPPEKREEIFNELIQVL